MISPSVRKTLPLLNIIAKMNNTNRKRILSEVGGDDIIYKALKEIAHNTIKGNVKLNKSQKAKLKTHSRTLKGLCTSNKCLKRRKKLVEQIGGFLPILIPAVASLISSLVAKNV